MSIKLIENLVALCTLNDNALTADPFLEFLWLDPILDPDLELDILLSFSSLARSAFFSSNAYSPASFKPRSLEIFTRNFRHSTFSGNFRCTNWNDLSWKQVYASIYGLLKTIHDFRSKYISRCGCVSLRNACAKCHLLMATHWVTSQRLSIKIEFIYHLQKTRNKFHKFRVYLRDFFCKFLVSRFFFVNFEFLVNGR